MLRSIFKLMIFTAAILVLASCAGKDIPKKEVKLQWPPLPEEPKIAYIHMYAGTDDFKKSDRSALDAFLGEDASAGKGMKFRKPYGVCAEGEKFYTTDTALKVVFVFDLKKEEVTLLGNKGRGRLGMPAGIAIDKEGTVFVADTLQKKVFGYDQTGALKVAIGKKEEFVRPTGLAINKLLGRLYVVDTKGHKIKVYSTAGEHLFDFGKRGTAEGEFNFPSNVAIDRRNGNVVVVDTQNFRVQVFNKDGEFIFKFGGPGDGPGSFARPKGVGIDSEGHIYVADSAFSNFQIFDEKGQVRMFIGGPGVGLGQFQMPTGLHVDEDDKVYVVGNFFGRVQVFQYVSEKFKKAFPEKYKAMMTLDGQK